MQIIKDTAEFDSVLKENTAVLVDFYADWCGPCKMLAPVLEEVAGKVDGVKVVKVNVDDNQEIAQRFGIMSIPTLIGFKNGEQAASSLGFKPAAELESLLKSLL